MTKTEKLLEKTMISPEFQVELREKYNSEGSALRDAQLKMLELLKFVDKICRENGLRYWLTGGTLIGAARHGGFIPWDDDVDICMPRPDALKLKEIMRDKVFDGHIVLQTNDSDSKFFQLAWFVVRDLKTVYIQDDWFHNNFKYQGLQVDIFIMDEGVSLPLYKLSRLMGILGIFYPGKNHFGMKVFRPLISPTFKFLDRIVFTVMRMFKGKKDRIITDYGGIFYMDYPKEMVYPLSEIEFEGYTFKAPADVDGMLKDMYGDWATVPDEQHRETHNVEFKTL